MGLLALRELKRTEKFRCDNLIYYKKKKIVAGNMAVAPWYKTTKVIPDETV